MKRILFIFAAAVLAASCEQNLEGTLYRPNSDDGKEIHFNISKIEKIFDAELPSGLIELTVVRPGTLGEHSIELAQMGAEADIFSFPQYVTIPDGEYSVVAPIVVNLKNCVRGSSYSTNIYIVARDQATGDYGVKNSQYSDAVAITISKKIEWAPLMVKNETTGEEVQQTATYKYDAYWHGTSTKLLVEKAVCEQTIYRVSGWGTQDVNFMWSVNEDKSCVVPKQTTGVLNSSYNQYIYVSDYPHDTNLNYTYTSYPCTWDGDRTFTFNLIYYREGSTGNFGKGVETMTFDIMGEPDPEVKIAYNGIDSTITGFIGAKLAFEKNENTGFYKIAFFDSALDTTAIKAAADSLAKEGATVEGASQIQTFYSDDSQSWNLKKGPHTLVGVPFTQEGKCGANASLVFTFDPESTYCVNVLEFTFEQDPDTTSIDPTSTLTYRLKTQHLVKGWYSCRKSSAWTTLLKTKTLEEIVVSGTEMSPAFIAAANSSSGRSSYYKNLSSGTEYMLAMVLENQYGERVVISKTASTEKKASDRGIEHFKKDVTMNDFLGSYLMTVGVGSSMSSTTEKTLRVDINKMDDNKVIISGLASVIKDFDPMIVAYFDSERHCLVLDCQDVDPFDGCIPRFAFYTGTSYVRAAAGMVLGWVNDKVIWVSSPDFTYTAVGYTFMKYDAHGTYLGGIVDSKVFVGPEMEPLERPK